MLQENNGLGQVDLKNGNGTAINDNSNSISNGGSGLTSGVRLMKFLEFENCLPCIYISHSKCRNNIKKLYLSRKKN